VGRLSDVTVYFDPETGDIMVDTNGQGGDCVKLTEALERLLGIRPDAARVTKAEYFEGGDGKKRTESLRRG
jgi:hypothetical protein